MICSELELAIGDDHSGILVLPADAPLGADFAGYAGLRDVVLDIAVTPDRGYALSVRGVARELASACGISSPTRPRRSPPMTPARRRACTRRASPIRPAATGSCCARRAGWTPRPGRRCGCGCGWPGPCGSNTWCDMACTRVPAAGYAAMAAAELEAQQAEASEQAMYGEGGGERAGRGAGGAGGVGRGVLGRAVEHPPHRQPCTRQVRRRRTRPSGQESSHRCAASTMRSY